MAAAIGWVNKYGRKEHIVHNVFGVVILNCATVEECNALYKYLRSYNFEASRKSRADSQEA